VRVVGGQFQKRGCLKTSPRASCQERSISATQILLTLQSPSQNDPKASAVNLEAIGGSTLSAVCHATGRGILVLRQRSLNETG
jgi:hypothetical protein